MFVNLAAVLRRSSIEDVREFGAAIAYQPDPGSKNSRVPKLNGQSINIEYELRNRQIDAVLGRLQMLKTYYVRGWQRAAVELERSGHVKIPRRKGRYFRPTDHSDRSSKGGGLMSEQATSTKHVDPNDPEAIAARDAVVGRAMRLMVFDRSGHLAAGVCEAAELEAARFDAAIERQESHAEPEP